MRKDSLPDIQPVISREGLRYKHKAPSVTSSKPSATSRRKKKTESQVTYLNGLYHRLNGVWDGSVRKEAMAATGLSRIQIYKWFFDRSM